MANNFQTLKNEFENLLLEFVINNNKDNKKKWHSARKMVKESKILKSLYLVYENINKCDIKDKNTLEIFLKENVSVFNKFTKKEILSECERFSAHLGKDGEGDDNLFNIILESASDSKISKLKYKATLLNEMVENIHAKNSEDCGCEEVSEEESLTLEECKEKLKQIAEKYSFLNEKEMSVLNAFLTNDDKEKERVFENLKTDNINFIKRTLYEGEELDSEITEMLKESEIKMKNMNFSSETKIEDFIKLLEFNK